MIAPLVWIGVVSSVHTQSVPRAVAGFIATFSLAATEVVASPGAESSRSQRDALARTLLSLAKTDTQTLDQAFALLDRNESMQRLVAGQILLILLFDIPKALNWSDPSTLALRSVLIPQGDKRGSTWNSSTWPWISKGAVLWKLEGFSVGGSVGDKSLTLHLKLYEERFQRRKFPTQPALDPT